MNPRRSATNGAMSPEPVHEPLMEPKSAPPHITLASMSYISSTTTRPSTVHNGFLDRANQWAKGGIESTVAAYSQIHEKLGLPPLVAGMWRRTLVRMCQDAGIILGLIAAVQAQCIFLLPLPLTTPLQQGIALLFYSALLLDLSGAAMSFLISQCGQLLDQQFTSSDSDTEKKSTETLEVYLIRNQPFIHRINTIMIATCGLALVVVTALGSAAFVVGILLYAWSELPIAVARGVTAAFVIAALPVALFLLVYGLIAISFLFAGFRVKMRLKRAQSEGIARSDADYA